MTIAPTDHTPQLRRLMQPAGFSSFKALRLASNVSDKQIRHLRYGDLAHLRVETLIKLAIALQISVPDLLTCFVPLASCVPAAPLSPPSTDLTDLKQEYDRLQMQLSQQKQQLWQEFQQSSVQVLESLLLQLPTAAYAAQQNPQAPAVKLLPLLRPIDRLLQQWGIEAISSVGSQVPYDPQQHQLLDGSAQPGDLVKVRYTGYRQNDILLYRAKVSPV